MMIFKISYLSNDKGFSRKLFEEYVCSVFKMSVVELLIFMIKFIIENVPTSPKILSPFPWPYHGAASIQLIPLLIALSITLQDSSSFVFRYILPTAVTPDNKS